MVEKRKHFFTGGRPLSMQLKHLIFSTGTRCDHYCDGECKLEPDQVIIPDICHIKATEILVSKNRQWKGTYYVLNDITAFNSLSV